MSALADGYPLSPQQARVVQHGLATGAGLTTVAAIRIDGALDVDRLRSALDRLVADHEILRTRIGETSQFVGAPDPLTLDVTAVADADDDTGHATVDRAIAELRARPAAAVADAPLVANLFVWSDRSATLLLAGSAALLDARSIEHVTAAIAAEIVPPPERAAEPDDEDESMQYADVATWLLDLLDDPDEADGRLFWQSYWRGFWSRPASAGASAVRLPFQDERTDAHSFTPAAVTRRFDAAPIDSLATANGIDPEAVLAAAFRIVLARFTAGAAPLIGIGSDGREFEELASVIGPLAKFLPLDVPVDLASPFGEIAKQIHREAARVREWEAFFDWTDAAKDCAADEAPTHFGFTFDYMIAAAPARADDAVLTVESIEPWIDRSDLGLWCRHSDDDVSATVAYDAATLSEADARRVADAVFAVIRDAADHPATPSHALRLLSDAEWQRLVVDFNRTDADYPRNATIHEQIEDQAARTPDHVAVRFESEGALTYAALDQRANQLAHHLQARGVGPDVRVAIAVDRSVDMIVGILGILKAGGCYVPVDPTYPEDRIAFMIEQTEAPVAVTHRGYDAFFPADPTIVRLDEDQGAIAAEPNTKPTSTVGPENLVYVIYTSGSTGRPKGVMITHEGLVISNQARIAAFDGPVGTFLLLSPLAFDSSVVGVFWTLLTGGTLLLVPKDTQQQPGRLTELIAEHDVTHLLTLPSFYGLLLEHAAADQLATLTCAIVAGEACPKKLIERHRVALPQCGMFSEYGATETTVWASITDCLRQTLNFASLGVPIQNAQMYVLDEHLSPLPVGVPGEVHFGGPAIAPGYLGRPDLTAERFIPDPFRPGGTLYKSGDLARHVETGEIEFLGRIDNQVKIRGFRVELEEIDAVLCQHPDLREAVVDARSVAEDSASKRLVAYVVPYPGKAPSIAELQAGLTEQLPEYMVPATFVTLDGLPKTPNGKIDRRALPEPERASTPTDGDAAPRPGAESILAEIWCELLRLDSVGREDNFFELGGDSILSIQTVARAKRAGLEITARDVFLNQTIASLTTAAGGSSALGTAPASQAEQGVVTGDLPLTPIQQWFFEREPVEPHHANMSLLFAARERLDPTTLEAAFQQLLDHHDALRLRYVRTERGWQQSIAGHETLDYETRDLTALAGDAITAAIESHARTRQASLDLTDGPLLRVTYFDLGPDDAARVLVVVHHLAFDGVSWRIFLEDLHTAYARLQAAPAAGRDGATSTLPAKTTSFKAWASRLVEYASTDAFAATLDYWRPAPGDVTAIPLDHPDALDRNTVETARHVTRSLTATETDALLQIAPKTLETRIDEVLVTALALALRDWTGGDAHLVDLEGHGREDILEGVDLSRTIGWFTSTYPARLALPDDPDPHTALACIKGQLRAIPQRGIGYGIAQYLRENDDLAAALRSRPTPTINYNYLGQFDQVLGDLFRLAPEAFAPDFSPRQMRSHALEVVGTVIDGRLQIEWTYGDRLHDAATIESLADRYLRTLRTLLAPCLPAVDRYPLSPLQKGLLFHSLAETETETYYETFECTLRGPFDIEAMTRAWQRVVDRYAILRTDFAWEAVPEPIQIVHRDVTIAVEPLDWRDESAAERDAALRDWSTVERTRRFDLSAAPLMRLTAIRTADDEHRFIWGFHHLIMDGWSMFIVLDEVFQAYDAFASGGDPIGITALASSRPPAYREYIDWLQHQDSAAAERYWRRALTGFNAPTPLHVDRASSVATEAGIAHEGEQGLGQRTLSAATTAALERLCREHRVTMNTVVQGAWALLLSRYGGTSDVVFGATVSGRPAALPGVEAMVGLFINTQPVRVVLDPAATVADQLRKMQAEQVEAIQYDYVSLGEVQGWSELGAGQQLFDTIFIFENYKKDKPIEAMCSSLMVDDIDWSESTNFAIRAHAMPGERMVLSLLYQRERLDEATIERMLGHWETLLHGIADDPTGPVGDIALAAADERAALTDAHLKTTAFATTAQTIQSRFEAAAERFADRVATSFGDETLTYRALNERANRVAHRLREIGVGPESRVGLATERSLDLVVGLLGILKAGGGYVPLDPTYPAERLRFMASDSGMNALVTDGTGIDKLPPEGLAIVRLDDPSLAEQSTENPTSDLSEEHLAYVIYTSGSTGTPKGCMVEHGNVVRLMDATADWFSFDERDVWTLFHSYAFDFSVWELWGALFCGGKVVVVPYGVSRSPEAFYRLLREERVTVLNQTPSAFYQLVRTEEVEGEADDLALRFVIFGGEALDLARLRPWYARHSDDAPTLINMYGITETTVHVTYRPLTRQDVEEGRGSVIGVAIPDLELYVLDEGLRPCPIGVPGEIFVGGAGLSRGYLNRPELTAERFIPHPFSPVEGARLYRTGDVGRWLDASADDDEDDNDGGTDRELEYLGRNDQQVQLRGFRIELGEIEAALQRHEAVREAVVLAREDEPGDLRIVAYAIPAEGTEGTPTPGLEELRPFLLESLPDYMVPVAVVWLDAYPLTANGKLDRDALPAPEHEAGPRDGFVAPRSDTEERLAAIWADVLGLERVGVEDNFFEIGGDSIRTIQIISRANETGLSLTPMQLFEHQTVAALAAIADGTDAATATGETAALSPAQQLFFAAGHPEPEAWSRVQHYRVDGRLDGRLDGAIDRARVESAVSEVFAAHDGLRLVFEGTDDAPTPRVESFAEPPFRFIDLAALPADAQDEAISALTDEARAGIDLATGPLVHFAHFGRGDAPDSLVVIGHELVLDPTGWTVVGEELARRLASETDAAASAPPAPGFSRAIASLESRDLAPARDYWVARGRETTAPSNWLSPDRPSGTNRIDEGARCAIMLDGPESESLRADAARSYQAEPIDLALAALARSAASGVWCDVVDPAVENVTTRTPGAFHRATPVFIRDPGDTDTLIKAAKEARRAIPGGALDFAILRATGEVTSGPDVPMRLSYARSPGGVLNLESVSSAPQSTAQGDRSYELEIEMIETATGIRIECTYGRGRFDAATVENAIERFRSALRELAAHCGSTEAGGFTPSDFPDAGLDQSALDSFISKISRPKNEPK